jgi:uncharacterized protein YbbK (DUF523 family)
VPWPAASIRVATISNTSSLAPAAVASRFGAICAGVMRGMTVPTARARLVQMKTSRRVPQFGGDVLT